MRPERLSTEITEIISAADAEASKLVVTSEEREAIKEQVIERSSHLAFDDLFGPSGGEISEEEFLGELDTQERFYHRRKFGGGFVGISRFLSHLGAQGYSHTRSREMLDYLIQKGMIEVYYVANPYNDQIPTAAIRRIWRDEDMPTI